MIVGFNWPRPADVAMEGVDYEPLQIINQSAKIKYRNYNRSILCDKDKIKVSGTPK